MLSADRIWTFGGDLLAGSAVIGAGLGALGALVTYALRRPATDPFFQVLVRRASERYLDTGITAWEFARGKLSGDPVYAAALSALAGARGTLLDIGCGQGLTLAIVAEAQAQAAQGAWDPTRPDPPQFDRLVGVETRPRVAAIAARALEHEAEIVAGDARRAALPPHDVAVIFDVLHMMPDADQRALLRAVRRALSPAGRLIVREADASAGWRFGMVRLGNRLKAIVTGHWRQSFTFRTAAEWRALLHEEGFTSGDPASPASTADVQPMSEGTPFANVLISAGVRVGAG
jgi:SAM-dependent methyltransferase